MQYYDKEAVGRRIQAIRKSRGLTQEILARQLDYGSVRQLQRIENGTSGCSVDKIMEIAQILHTSTDSLLFEEKENSSSYEQFSSLLAETSAEQQTYVYCVLKAVVDHLPSLQTARHEMSCCLGIHGRKQESLNPLLYNEGQKQPYDLYNKEGA